MVGEIPPWLPLWQFRGGHGGTAPTKNRRFGDYCTGALGDRYSNPSYGDKWSLCHSSINHLPTEILQREHTYTYLSTVSLQPTLDASWQLNKLMSG